MKKSLLLCLLILPLVLAACGGLKEEDAEETLNAYFAGNRSEANENICTSQRLNAQNAEILSEMEITVDSVSCEKNGSRMQCSYTLTSGEETIENTINFTVRNNDLCSPIPMPEFGAAEPEDEEAAPDEEEATEEPEG